MSLGDFLLLGLAFCYAVLPYTLLLLASAPGRRQESLPGRLLVGSIVGLAAFLLVATTVSLWSFELYRGFHLWLCAAGLVLAGWRWRRAGGRPHEPLLQGVDYAAGALVLAALAVRLVPVLVGGESLGGYDASFHSILAHKIVVEGRLTESWLPIAAVPVVYPRGVHVLCAFLARTSGLPVHDAVNALIPILGALTTGLVVGLGKTLFASRSAGLLAGSVYAFLARWGSLDYFRWAGLPSAAGMLLLCTLMLIVLRGARSEQSDTPALRRASVVAGGLALAAIAVAHHHSFLVTLLVLACGFTFTSSREVRRWVLHLGATGLTLALPWIATRYLEFAGDLGSTGVFVFREPPLTLWDCALSLNPAFVVLFVVAAAATRRMQSGSGRLLILAWVAALLSAFVFLEYVYRAGALIATGGGDFFTALTPSRMAGDLAYPMSVLCGGLAVSSLWRRFKTALLAALTVAGLITTAYVWQEQYRIGVYPELQEVGGWLEANTPEDSLVWSVLPYLPYLAWREASHPPLPASEPRNHPDILRHQERSLPAWQDWTAATGRHVYLVWPQKSAPPLPLPLVFSNSLVLIYELRPDPGGPRP